MNTNSREKLTKFFMENRGYFYRTAKNASRPGVNIEDVLQRAFLVLLRPENAIDWDKQPLYYIARTVRYTAMNENQLEHKHRPERGSIPLTRIDHDAVLDVRAAIEHGFEGVEREAVIAYFLEGVKGKEFSRRFPDKHSGSWRRWIRLTATPKLRRLLVSYRQDNM